MAIKLSAPPTADVLLDAYEKHAEDIRKLPDDKLLTRVNFDFTAAVAVALGAQPASLVHRATIRDELPKIPLRYVDHLDGIAHAALYVYLQSQQAPTSESNLATLADEAKVLRKKLQADAGAAIAHEFMEETALEGVPTGNGRLEIAHGLLGLCVAFRAAWPKVKGHTAVTDALLITATQKAVALIAALGRDENPIVSAAGRWRRRRRVDARRLRRNIRMLGRGLQRRRRSIRMPGGATSTSQRPAFECCVGRRDVAERAIECSRECPEVTTRSMRMLGGRLPRRARSFRMLR